MDDRCAFVCGAAHGCRARTHDRLSCARLKGVTRDRRDADASIGDLEFRLIDTAGLEEIQKFLLKDKHEYQLINNEPMNADLQQNIIQQTENAIAECVSAHESTATWWVRGGCETHSDSC
jgi:hypothetical protein